MKKSYLYEDLVKLTILFLLVFENKRLDAIKYYWIKVFIIILDCMTYSPEQLHTQSHVLSNTNPFFFI